MLHDLFFDYTLRTVALGTAGIGAVSGMLGSFAVLRRQSLLGDAIAHAALPGIVLAYILTRTRSSVVLLVGAIAAGWLGALAVGAIVRHSRIRYDSALGIVLSVFFGAGLVLLTLLQRGEDAGQAGLEDLLFGQAAALVAADLIAIGLFGGIAVITTILFWKEFKIASFDPDYAAATGIDTRRVEVLLTSCLVLAIAIGLQAVGVVLMTALVVAPGAAARQWTHGLARMVLLAMAIGAFAGVGGVLVSVSATGLPTGPIIVVLASCFALISLLLGTKKGSVWEALARRRSRSRVRLQTVLLDLHTLAESHEDPGHPHPAETLQAIDADGAPVLPTLRSLKRDGLVAEVEQGQWALTEDGRITARRVAREEPEPRR